MNSLSKEQRALLALLRNVLWYNQPNLCDADWRLIEEVANQQGILGMLYLGGKLYSSQIPPEKLSSWRADMIGNVMRNIEINTVQELIITYLKKHNIRVAVLKGLSCSVYYPKTEIRALGDIDLLIDEDNLPKVDEYLRQNGFKPAENDHAFHVGYYGNGVAVEIHYAITEFPYSKGGKAAQTIAKKFLDHVKTVHVNGMSFPVLSDSDQALMLLTHMERHMLEAGIGLRQLCDWMMFVYGSELTHWQEKTLSMLNECGLITFAKVVTKTCVNYIGLNQEKAPWCMDVDDELTEGMIREIFRSGSMGATEGDHLSSLFFARKQLGRSGQNRFKGLLLQISKLSYMHFPFTKKCKSLLPFFWVFIPVRYFVRSLLGLRPKKNVKKLLDDSNQRQKLYKSLNLYVTKK